ncbi:MAG: tetratricopeptide repeat protein [Magnetococcales bacterium]|nr:tetratricopeptide repeat protein [Magnetococcales bacterium]
MTLTDIERQRLIQQAADHQNQGALPLAEQCYRQALALAPQEAQIMVDLAALLRRMEQNKEAVLLYQQALGHYPYHWGLHLELGNTLLDMGHQEQASQHYQQARTLQPQNPLPHHNLGLIYLKNSLWEEAADHLKQALKLDPNHQISWRELGVVSLELGRMDEAIGQFGQALILDPHDFMAHNNLGNALKDQGNAEQALNAYRQSLALVPDHPVSQSNVLLCHQYDPKITAAKLFEIHHTWATQWADHLPHLVRRGVRCSPADGPLRVGILSADLRQHPVGTLLLGWLEHRASACRPLEIHIFSDTKGEDAVTARLRQASDGWTQTRHLTDPELAEAIEQRGIDILFDMAGHTAGNRLRVFARRPAPMQISWAGYVGTTGLKAMDFLLADRHYVPEGESALYTETILRMPHCYAVYRPPVEPPQAAHPAPCIQKGFVTFGALQNPIKINHEVACRWAEILAAVPGSRLVLQYHFMTHPENRKRILKPMTALGVDAERIDFHDRTDPQSLLTRYQQIDIALDTFPYSGGLTTCEALWMGVPVVTFPGRSFAGRHAASYLHGAGLTETIARNATHYVEKAIALGHDPRRIAELHAKLRQQTAASPMADPSTFTKALHQQLYQAWEGLTQEGVAG